MATFSPAAPGTQGALQGASPDESAPEAAGSGANNVSKAPDTTRVTYDLLIGADGVNSATRGKMQVGRRCWVGWGMGEWEMLWAGDGCCVLRAGGWGAVGGKGHVWQGEKGNPLSQSDLRRWWVKFTLNIETISAVYLLSQVGL